MSLVQSIIKIRDRVAERFPDKSNRDISKITDELIVEMLDNFEYVENYLDKLKDNVVDTYPTGFLKPVYITKSLADFLQVDQDTPHSRVYITQLLIKYIKANKLSH